MNTSQKHCVVIGAGIVGSSCAWNLLKDGHQVTVIDSELPGQSTSFGNAGCISPSSVIPFSYPGAIRQVPKWLIDKQGPLVIRLTDLSHVVPWLWKFWRSGSMKKVEAIAQAQTDLMASVRSDYDQILAETGSEWLVKHNGLITLYDDEKSFREESWQYELRRRLGQQWKELTAEELAELEPSLAQNHDAKKQVAVFDPVWSHLTDPGEVTRNIAEAGFASGVQWKQDRVKQIQPAENEVLVRTESGDEVRADYLVVAAGVWSAQLLASLGMKVPLAAKRGYHTMVHQPSVELNHPVMSVSKFFVLTPMRLGLRLAGTAEFAAIDAEPDYRRAKILLEHARSYLPDLQGESYSEWMGQRPMMPDSKPVIDRVPGQPRILGAFGHGHYGLTQGPTSGRIIADLVAGREPHLDLSPFAMDRF